MLAYYPEQKVFIDDRYDMYPRKVISAYFVLSEGSPGWERELDRYKVDVVVWNKGLPLAQYLARDDRWHRTYHDGTYAMFVRNGT